MNIQDFLNPGFIVGLIGAIVGVWGVYYGYKGRRIQILEYQISSSRIITNRTNNIPGLKIVIGDEFASDLISSQIVFFNRGNMPIKQNDFATLAHLQITASGHFFNLESISKDTIESNNLHLNPSLEFPDNRTISIQFEYLKPKQFFSISVLHDGEIEVSGDLTTGKLRKQDNSSGKLTSEVSNINNLYNWLFTILVSLVAVVLCLFLSLRVFSPIKVNFGEEKNTSQGNIEVRTYSELLTTYDKLLQDIITLREQNETYAKQIMELQDTLKSYAEHSN